MPLSGLKFKKETNPLSRRIQRLFERTRADYLSAKQEPKTYTKDWMKAIERLQNIYAELMILHLHLKKFYLKIC